MFKFDNTDGQALNYFIFENEHEYLFFGSKRTPENKIYASAFKYFKKTGNIEILKEYILDNSQEIENIIKEFSTKYTLKQFIDLEKCKTISEAEKQLEKSPLIKNLKPFQNLFP